MAVLTPDKEGESIAESHLSYRLKEFESLKNRDGAMFSGEERNCFFTTQDGINFKDSAYQYNLDFPYDGRGVVAADLDRDGFQDLIIRNLQDPRIQILMQKSSPQMEKPPEGHFVQVDFPLQSGSTIPYGARLRIVSPFQGESQFLLAGSGYLTQKPHQVHLGIGDCQSVEVEIQIPGGEAVISKPIPANSRIQFDIKNLTFNSVQSLNNLPHKSWVSNKKSSNIVKIIPVGSRAQAVLSEFPLFFKNLKTNSPFLFKGGKFMIPAEGEKYPTSIENIKKKGLNLFFEGLDYNLHISEENFEEFKNFFSL